MMEDAMFGPFGRTTSSPSPPSASLTPPSLASSPPSGSSMHVYNILLIDVHD